MKLRGGGFGVILGALLLAPTWASAEPQAPSPPQNAALTAEKKVAVMYTWEMNHGDSEFAPFGAAVDFSKKLKDYAADKSLYVVGQYVFGYFRNGNGAVSKFSGGVRYALSRRGSIVPYVQGLAGLWHGSGENYLQTSIGGGFDIVTSALKDKVLRIDATWVVFFDDPENGLRLNVGIVWPLGKR